MSCRDVSWNCSAVTGQSGFQSIWVSTNDIHTVAHWGAVCLRWGRWGKTGRLCSPSNITARRKCLPAKEDCMCTQPAMINHATWVQMAQTTAEMRTKQDPRCRCSTNTGSVMPLSAANHDVVVSPLIMHRYRRRGVSSFYLLLLVTVHPFLKMSANPAPGSTCFHRSKERLHMVYGACLLL